MFSASEAGCGGENQEPLNRIRVLKTNNQKPGFTDTALDSDTAMRPPVAATVRIK
jgi:hypothetical protein